MTSAVAIPVNTNVEYQKSEGISVDSFSEDQLIVKSDIYIIRLKSGSYYEMGKQYGSLLKEQMLEVLELIRDYYITQHSVSYEKITNLGIHLYYKFPLRIQAMLEGISYGSGISLNDCIVLSAIQFISPYFVPDLSSTKNDQFQCSFVSLSQSRTKSGYPIIGRFFDLFPPFEKVVKYLTVTIFPETPSGEKSFIMIGFPGEIQCLTCFNELGLFLEVNNGGFSGGKVVHWEKSFMPGRYFQIISESVDIYQMQYQINSISPDFSWITNIVDTKFKKVFSFEFSSLRDTHTLGDVTNKDFVVTNFFVNNTWENLPVPHDNETWYGVTRYKNLKNLVENSLPENEVTIEMFQEKVMDVNISRGGALWSETVYQAVFDPEFNVLYLRSPLYNMTWTQINF